MLIKTSTLPYKLFAAAIAFGLFSLSVPQLCSAVLRLYASEPSVLDQRDPATDIDLISRRIVLLDLADGWFGDPEARIEAGLDQLTAARLLGGQGQSNRAQVEAAAADLSSGLSRAPAAPRAWLALGDARLALGDQSGAAAALRASILFGSYELALVLQRAELGLDLWPILSSDDKRSVAQQMRLAWERDPRGLVALVRLRQQAFPVMIALAQNPDQLSSFMRALSASR